MGAAPSTPYTVERLVGTFVGDESLPLSSDFWQKLLELPYDAELPFERVHEACQLLGFSYTLAFSRHSFVLRRLKSVPSFKVLLF